MSGIAKQAAFYRGYLTDERSLVPLTILLATVVALWLLVYLVAAVAEAHQAGAWRAATVNLHPRPSGRELADPARRLRPGQSFHRMGDVVAWLSRRQFPVVRAAPQQQPSIEPGARKAHLMPRGVPPAAEAELARSTGRRETTRYSPDT